MIVTVIVKRKGKFLTEKTPFNICIWKIKLVLNYSRFEVEAILDSKEMEEGQRLYLIKWKGFEKEDDNTWEPEENIDCKYDQY